MEPSEYLADENLSDLEIPSDAWKSCFSTSSSFLSLSMEPGTLPSPPSDYPLWPAGLRKLRFVNSPPSTIITSSRIEGEDGSPITIELVDAVTNARVTSDLRLEIVALGTDITEENLTTEEFNRNMRQQLLVGDLTVKLKDGVGVISGDVAFTDKSTHAYRKQYTESRITGGSDLSDQQSQKRQRQILGPRPSPLIISKDSHKIKIYGPRPSPLIISKDSHKIKISGPRPSPLIIRKVSHKIKKPPKHPPHLDQPLPIYNVSRKRWNVDTTPSDFRNVVQRLTGISSAVFFESDNGKGVSPAARLAATENACQRRGKESAARYETVELEEAVEFGDHASGIILPSPEIHQGGISPSEGSMSPGYVASALDLFSSDSRFLDTSVASRSSKNMQDTESSIGFPGSSVDERSQITNLSGCDSGLQSTRVGSSDSKDYYDVVIKYKRGDISNDDFTSHLRAALCRRGISVDQDFDHVYTVPECRVLIIFLTTAHVPSSLVNILEHQGKERRVVYPIYYGISPSDLIGNHKNYERFFLQDERKRWQAAWKEITQTPGYILTDKSESELIDEIVIDALKVLRTNDNEKMIGMDMQVEEILSLLCIESPDVRSIGIWGTVGVGKTAIAEEIFRKISVQYETCVFLKDLHKEVELKGHDAVREDFLSKVLEVEPHVIRISDMKTSFLRSRLQRKRILVVLDDVNDFGDVETFLEKINYFGPGSRIILTSRNRRVFVHCKTDHVYEVKPLDVSKSLLLLGLDTFQNVTSTEVFRTLTLEMVKFSNGHPQVLQFCSKSDAALNQSYEAVVKFFLIYKEWEMLSQRIQKTSPIFIPGIFERSCIGLDDNERSIFLDIACFFGRMDKDKVAMLRDGCGFSAHVGLRSLVDKSLLTISHNMVDMLSFLRATGREIVRQESPDRPGDRSRLWNSEEIMEIFIDDTGTSAIEGIFLDLSKLQFDANPYVFEKMCNLRLLKFYFSEVVENHGVSLRQGLENLPSKLRLLHWEYYPLSSLPWSFDPKNLVELNLPNSCANQLWKGKKSLEKLRKMRLSYSYQLTKIPRLSNAPNLEHIDLEGCSSLASISQSISSLKKLVFLNLKDCSRLESVPSTVDLESLEVLNISGCSKLETLPEISPNVKELYMGATMIQEIPSSIKNLVSLEKLDLENSRHLVNLPTSICKLKHLETLNLSGCSSLERFPELSRRMKCLKSLDLSRTAVKVLHSSISYMVALEELRFVECKNLVRLPDNAWSLRFKVEFRQIDAEKFSKLWNRFGWLKKAQVS